MDPLPILALLLSQGCIVAWFSGRSEFGPRVLGGRSILGDPRSVFAKQRILRYKRRERFMPLAPSVLEERQREFFNLESSSLYMLLTAEVRPEKRHLIPAAIHVDGNARLQTVTQEMCPDFYRVIKEFEYFTGIPMLLNTSLNRKGEPIAETPADAYNVFINEDIDALYLEGRLYVKSKCVKQQEYIKELVLVNS
jgi:carbamoyltransferase